MKMALEYHRERQRRRINKSAKTRSVSLKGDGVKRRSMAAKIGGIAKA
jgi:hypothetical protein